MVKTLLSSGEDAMLSSVVSKVMSSSPTPTAIMRTSLFWSSDAALLGSKPLAALPPVMTTTTFAASDRVSGNMSSMMASSPVLVWVSPPS